MALLIACSSRAEQFAAHIRREAPDLDVRIAPDVGNPAEIDTALCWLPPRGLMATLPNLQLIVSVGAGVDALLDDPTLPHAPLVRFVDPDLTGRMAEYIALQVLYHQRRMTEYRALQAERTWTYIPEAAAHEVRVGLMGLGVLGTAAAQVLKAVGYQVRSWTRTPKAVPGVTSFVGDAARDDFLAETDILAVILPLTGDTRGILDRNLIQKLSRRGRTPLLPGPVLINAGRGGLQIDADIHAALEAGELYAASLDVFQVEPLPASSPFWAHPRVVVTPHNAAESSPLAIARYAIRQMRRRAAGEALENVVDRRRGY